MLLSLLLLLLLLLFTLLLLLLLLWLLTRSQLGHDWLLFMLRIAAPSDAAAKASALQTVLTQCS